MSLKIVFHILRHNWYRVLAAPIAEALQRGWAVECWHAKYPAGILGDNQPRRDRVPVFKDRQPKVIDYQGENGLGQLIHATDAKAIVDIEVSSVAKLCEKTSIPVSVFLDGLTHPILSRFQAGQLKVLPAYDLFALPSKQHLSRILEIMSQDKKKILALSSNDGKSEIDYFRKFLNGYWTSKEEQYFLKHSYIVGTPELDDVGLIDPLEVRKRWGLPSSHQIVGLLPSPWDMSVGAFCGDLNNCRTFCGILLTVLKYKNIGLLKSALYAPKNRQILKAIRKFCDFNNALLLTKLRHSRNVSNVLKDVSDKIIGEDGYYPHSALELFAVADVVFGFTTSGIYECVAANSSYVDIEIPFFPKEFYIQHVVPSLLGTKGWKGVAWSMSAESIVRNLPVTSIDEFKLDEDQRDKFLRRFSTYYDGLSSARFLDIVEKQVANKECNLSTF